MNNQWNASVVTPIDEANAAIAANGGLETTTAGLAVNVDDNTIIINQSGELEAIGGSATTYTAGNYISITDGVIAATGLQPSGNYQEAGSYVSSDELANLMPLSASSSFQPAGNYQTAGSYQPAGDYVVPSDLEPYAKTEDLSAYQPRGSYQTAGDYVSSSELSAYQPAGDYQSAGDYVSSTELNNYQSTAGMSAYALNSALALKLDASASSAFITSTAGLATTADLADKLDKSASANFIPTSASSEFIPESASGGFMLVQDMSGYATTAALGEKLDSSASSAFITSTAGLATTAEVNQKLDASASSAFQTIAGMGDYVGYSAIGTDSANQIISIHGSAIADAGVNYRAGQYIQISGDEISVTGVQSAGDYATTAQLAEKLDASATSGFLPASASSEFIPESASGGFQLVQDMSGYATTAALGEKLDASASSSFASTADLSAYIPKSATNLALGDSASAANASIAVGDSSYANDGSVSMGNGSTAEFNSIAFGYRAHGYDTSIALGYAQATGYSVAVGSNTQATGNSLGLGSSNTANENSLSIGTGNVSTAGGLALGTDNSALYNSIAVGASNTAWDNSQALGSNNYALHGFAAGNSLSAENITALGHHNLVTGSSSDNTAVIVVGDGGTFNRHDLAVLRNDGEIITYSSTADSVGFAFRSAIQGKLDISASSEFIPESASGGFQLVQDMSSYVGYSAIGTNSSDQITSIHGSSLASGANYSAGQYIQISGDEISVTGVQSAGDYQPAGNYASSSDLADYIPTASASSFMQASASSEFIPESASGGFQLVQDMSAYVGYSSIGTNSSDIITGIGGSSLAVGANYSAGQYVQISGDEISVTGIDPNSYASTADLTAKQDSSAMSAYVEKSSYDNLYSSFTGLSSYIDQYTAYFGDLSSISGKLDSTAIGIDPGNDIEIDIEEE